MENAQVSIDELVVKQKLIIKWSAALVALTLFHMLLDPILHWGKN